MRILIVLTYYRPHTSGLTIYAERLAKAFVKRGHQVTVLTSQYEEGLPVEEIQEGVRIVRAPVWFRISKGVVMPRFGKLASRLVREHDVIQLHLPQFDAAGVALRGRLLKKPTVITYHCDLLMPPGVLNWIANQAVHLMNNLAGFFTHRFVTYTRDYAENSPYLNRFMDKLQVIPPPVVLPDIPAMEITNFAKKHNPQNKGPVVGMAARFATEKGVGVLLEALPILFESFPNSVVHFAGPHQNIMGEESYYRRLRPVIDRYISDGHWKFLGSLDPQQMAAFYPNIDILVIPSLNSTEAFGLVQIEAMINGAPSIASNLPGVRKPVQFHSMGKVVPIGDSKALGEALVEILSDLPAYKSDSAPIIERYLPDTIAAAYERLFAGLLEELAR